jgi:hypothetical protein
MKPKQPKRLPGVFPNGNRFNAVLYVGSVRVLLGTFDTPEEAHRTYLDAKRIADNPQRAA